MKRIAINGFGRIGRTLLRTLLLNATALQELDVVAINLGPSRPEHLETLFAFDSIMGPFPGTVTSNAVALIINGKSIALFAEKDPEKLPWGKLIIDCVVEASGAFTDGEQAKRHCAAGAKKVLITAPGTHEDITIIPGVNTPSYNHAQHTIISLGSCTTNCLAPMVKVLHEAFSITQGLMTTTHAYTNDQVLLDVEHHDPRRARAAALNMIPTKTGASSVITKIFPDLEGKLNGLAVRVPVPIVSLIDFTFSSAKPLSVPAINEAFAAAAQGSLKGILRLETRPLVSSDFRGSEESCIIDSLMTQTIGNLGKVFGWYDNEYGYSCRLRDFLLHIL